MSYVIFHDPSKKTASVPRMALQLSGLAGKKKIRCDAENGCILLTRATPTVSERLELMVALDNLGEALMEKLARDCEKVLRENGPCGRCGLSGQCAIAIPPCVLEEAGIDPEAGLECGVEDGRVIVTAIPEDEDGPGAGPDPLDRLSGDALDLLEDCGIDLDGLRLLLEAEGRANG